jgi:glycosyltransferase involved in cell wall biosynthesis
VTPRRIRVLTLIESDFVSGHARVLIEFARLAAIPAPDLPVVDLAIATYWRGMGEGPVAELARSAGLTVFTISERGRWDREAIPQLRRIVSDYQPDILETRNVKSSFFVRLLGLNQARPWLAWHHGYTTKDWLNRVYNQVDRWSFRGAFRVVAVCESFADQLVSRGIGRKRITVLHNFARPFVPSPPAEVERLRDVLGLQGKAVILAVGRLSSEKGHAVLLRAAAQLEKMGEVPDFRVVLVGDGPEKQNLLRLMARLGIQNRIVMAGFQKDVRPYYSLGTVLALPSYSEGSPNVVLEAMAAGLPIAATAAGGVPEMLENRVTGLVVKPGDPQAMANALLELLRDSELAARLGDAARSCVQTDYTPAAYRRSLTQFYLDTLEAHAKSLQSTK